MSKPNKIKSVVAVLRANRPLRLLLIAIGLAILAAFLAVKYLQNREAALKEAYQQTSERMVNVIVASRNLGRGAVLSKATLSVRRMPSMYVHQQVVPPGKFNIVKGRRLLEPLAKGRALLWSHVTGDQRRDFSDVLKTGRRAVTIPIDQLTSIDGMVEPGNHVDLYITLPTKLVGGAGDGDVVFPLLQNVEVLATGRQLEAKVQATMAVSYGNRGRGYNTLTMNLTPKETALLFAANTAGRISASLRNRSDEGFVFTSVRPTQILSFAQSLAREVEKTKKVVRDASGKIVGRVVNGKVVNDKGEVIGHVNSDGTVVSNSGEIMGTVSKETIGKAKIVRDKNGKVIGHIINGKVLNDKGEVIGKVNADGSITNSTGDVIGTAAEESVMTEKVVRDKNGNVIGKIVDGKVVNDKGEVIGKVNDDGTVVSNTGESLGSVSEQVLTKVKVVRDKDGNVIGRVVNGKVVNGKGEIIGTVSKNGKVIGNDGKSLGSVSEEAVTPELVSKFSAGSASGGAAPVWLVDYLVGGNSKNGVAVVEKVPVE